MAVKTKVSRLLVMGKARLADAALHQTTLAVDQLQLDQAQQVTRVVDAIAGGLTRHLVVLAQHRGELQLLEVVRQQDLGRALSGPCRHDVRERGGR